MSYEITATRRRPKGFEELAGQEFVSATLEASLASGRIAHAYLFSGPRGCGKTSTARILAKALNCEKGPSARPCGECSNCKSIAAGSSLDVIEIDGASNTSVDNVRQIKDEVLFPPNSSRYKVYIIDEVHMLSMSAFNALLKTIEEPPPYVVFIFATTELHKVPATIKSRCQQFAFRLIPVDTVKSLLAEASRELSVEAEDEALLWIAKESGGSLRDAYTLFDQVVAFSEGRLTAAKIRDKLGLVGLDAMNALFEAAVSGDGGSTGAVLEGLDALLAQGLSPEQFAIHAIDYLRCLLLIRNGMGRDSLLGASASSFSSTVLEALDSERIERALGLFFDLHRNLRASPNPRFELELAVARLARLREFVSPSAISRAVSALTQGRPAPQAESRMGFSPSSPSAPPMPPSAGAPAPHTGGAEKKNPELSAGLPPALSSVFSSLAGAFGAPDPSAAPRAERPAARGGPAQVEAPQAAQPAPAPSVAPSLAPSLAPSVVQGAEEKEADPMFASDEDLAQSRAEAPPAGSGEGEAFRREVIARVGRANPLLGSGLASALDWDLGEGRLLITFRNGIDENIVRHELGLLSQTAAAVAGKALRVELRVGGSRGPGSRSPGGPGGQSPAAEGQADAATLVERMFRGQRIETKHRGGTDELR